MNASSNQVWQASLAITHLNEVIHDLSGERDRLQSLLQRECERREALAQAAEAWMSAFQDMAADMQTLTERMLQGVVELERHGPDADLLMEGARLMSLQRAQLKAMRSWLEVQQAQLRQARDEAPRKRMSRLNHLSEGLASTGQVRETSSEWGGLSSFSGVALRDETRSAPQGHAQRL